LFKKAVEIRNMSGERIQENLQSIRKRTNAMFSESQASGMKPHDECLAVKKVAKICGSYQSSGIATLKAQAANSSSVLMLTETVSSTNSSVDIDDTPNSTLSKPVLSSSADRQLVATIPTTSDGRGSRVASSSGTAVVSTPVPRWHAPWELSTVIAGHVGWVRAIALDPMNEYFATGSSDRTIKIWDLAKCCAGSEDSCRLTLTGHIDTVRAIAISSRHPYMFSAGEDKAVKCWDLETNTVIRNYHGHLSGVYSLSLHPTLDVLVTGGRDCVARVWDMRTKKEIHVLAGHKDAVGTILTNSVDPQIITGSYDSTVKTWDLAAGKVLTTLTHHKKSVRSLVLSPHELTFASASADGIRKWQCRDGKFLKNMSNHAAVVNSLAMNDDGVLFSGADNGSMRFWDYSTGYCYQETATVAQPGSLEAENGIFASTFDHSGSRLITCEADKSIKVWKENDTATEESHPVDLKRWVQEESVRKRY
jgi:pleiotropic regulator 1